MKNFFLFLFFISVVACRAQLVSAGGNHSLFLCPDSSVNAMGWDSYGQLGDGTQNWKTTPVFVTPTWGGNVKAISAGYVHSLFLKTDGTVWSVGYNGYGELGIGSYVQHTSAVQVNPTWGGTIISIAAGCWNSYFIKGDNTVWSVGDNAHGQIGDGTTTTKLNPVQVNSLAKIIKVAGGNFHSLFLKSDSTVWAVGGNSEGELGDGTFQDRYFPIQINGLTGITAISGGKYHSLFLKSDSTVWATGYNYYGQPGTMTGGGTNIPVQISGLSGIISISAGWYHSLFLKANGNVLGAGYNGNGQLGDTGLFKKTPILIKGLNGIVGISAASFHSMFLKNDGTGWGTGYNIYGQLGDSSTIQKGSVVQVVNLCSTVPSSVEEKNREDKINIYPNPASTILNLELGIKNAKIKITNLLGEEIQEARIKKQEQKIEVDVSSLQNGIYFVNVKTSEGLYTKKIMVQR